MRLFLTAFAFSAILTAASNLGWAQDDLSTDTQPIRQSRFETSSAQIYIMTRARREVEHREEMLRYYDRIGFNYGAPEINGSMQYLTVPPIRYRRVLRTPVLFNPIGAVDYGGF